MALGMEGMAAGIYQGWEQFWVGVVWSQFEGRRQDMVQRWVGTEAGDVVPRMAFSFSFFSSVTVDLWIFLAPSCSPHWKYLGSCVDKTCAVGFWAPQQWLGLAVSKPLLKQNNPSLTSCFSSVFASNCGPFPLLATQWGTPGGLFRFMLPHQQIGRPANRHYCWALLVFFWLVTAQASGFWSLSVLRM